jgi:hypothetical protein
LAAPFEKFPDAFAKLTQACLGIYTAVLEATGQKPAATMLPTLGALNAVLKELGQENA